MAYNGMLVQFPMPNGPESDLAMSSRTRAFRSTSSPSLQGTRSFTAEKATELVYPSTRLAIPEGMSCW